MSDYRVSFIENGFDFWEIGRWEWEHRALFEAEMFISRMTPCGGGWTVNVHEMLPDGTRRLVAAFTGACS